MKAARGGWVLLWAALMCGASDSKLELRGQVAGASAPVMVELFGVESPYTSNTLTDAKGRFRFRALAPGSYTVAVFVPGRLETRRTVVASPSLAGPKGTIEVTIPFPSDDARAIRPDYNTVPVRQLSVPDRARREYEEAEKQLGKRNREEAVRCLQEAVQMAPQFALAWNSLGVLAYQAQNYSEAERCFRQAISAQPGMYEATVNLGGVLLNLKRPEEAIPYNKFAVLERPGDALANSQLGLAYFELRQMNAAEQYLRTAKSLDPAHFSHPQIVLAQIDLWRGKQAAALEELNDFLKRFPDAPEGARVRRMIQHITTAMGTGGP